MSAHDPHPLTGCVRMPKWTLEDDTLLIKLADAGVPHAEIALRLNRTWRGCRNRIPLVRKGVTGNALRARGIGAGLEWTPEEERTLLDLRALGWSWVRLAEKLGRSRDACAARHTTLLNGGRTCRPRVETEAEPREAPLAIRILAQSGPWVGRRTMDLTTARLRARGHG